jgi:hypothetical protein
MATKDSVFQLLRQQKEEARNPPDREEWLSSLKTLMGMLQAWMADAIRQKLFQVEEFPVGIKEEQLGAYYAPGLKVVTPRGETIQIKPRARIVVGSLGRVDMECAPKKAMLVRTRPDHWQFAQLSSQGEWHFEDLTEESFWESVGGLLS